MDTTNNILSWNVQGLGSPHKHSQEFTTVLQSSAHLICLQETHLTFQHEHHLNKPCIQWTGHSYHTFNFRGVSILVDKSVPWECVSVKTDPLGQD